jgi:hypothetical protein
MPGPHFRRCCENRPLAGRRIQNIFGKAVMKGLPNSHRLLSNRKPRPKGSRYLSARRKGHTVGRDGRIQIISVMGPNGSKLTLADLPPPSTRRWVSSRKAKIVAAVEGGLLSFEEASRRYNLSLEEFHGWEETLHHRPPAAPQPARSSLTPSAPRRDPFLHRAHG